MNQSQEQPQDLDDLSIVVTDTTTHNSNSTALATSTISTGVAMTTTTTTTTTTSTFTTSIAAATEYQDTASTTFISLDDDDSLVASYCYPPTPPAPQSVLEEKTAVIETKTLVDVVALPTPAPTRAPTPTPPVDPSRLQQELQTLSTPKRTFENWARTFRCVPEQYYTPNTEGEIVK
ncbi:hypothetical protein BGZ92_008095, partial [Podila epicladia]